MNIELRTATAEDCPRLLELITELAIYENAPDEVTVTLDEFVSAGFGENPVWNCFVAVDGQTIVGLALFYIRYSTCFCRIISCTHFCLFVLIAG